VARFSALGAASVAALLLSGLYSTWLHAGSLEALRATAYGQTLLAKLAVFIPLLALAALNLLHWRRRVAGSAPAQQGFLRTLRAEAAVGVLVLALAGLLTGLGPARSALEARQAEALTMRATAGPLRASLTIRPPQAGPAHYEVSLTSPDGAPYEIARTVRLRFTPPDPSLGLAEARAEHQGGGRYSVEGAYLTLAGSWQVELQVQRPDGYDVFTRFDLEVDGAVRPASTGRGAQALGDALGWGLVAGGLVVTLFAFWLRRQRQHFAMAPLVLIMGLALLTTGALQRYDAFARWNTPVPVGNPVLPTEASIARGEALYQARCQSCHGTEGRGDGPLAASLDPPPADLGAHVPLHADAELFGVIADGIPGTAMPPHRDVLEEEAIWDVVNYVRALTGR
ncbi:MAG TPA: CopD family protein, partial [Ardenticatenaceae bacterium]|nr:CopD family protein [Ardenticatenaceae bacterium]